MGGWVNSCEFLEQGAFVQLADRRLLIAWGEPSMAARPVEGRASFFVPDFFLRGKEPWRVFPCHEIVTSEELVRRIGRGRRRRASWENPDKEAFCASVEMGLAMIRDGVITKAVPTAAMGSGVLFDGGQRAKLVAESILHAEGGFAYGLWSPREGIVGVTPEILFSTRDGGFQTEAVAGTATDPAVLGNSTKEQTEHKIVLEDIIHRCWGIEKVRRVVPGVTAVARIGQLWHLKTPISVEARVVGGFSALISALHPTPALGIAPRGDWAGTCAKLDVGERWRHGAPFGYSLSGETEACLVAIRCVQWMVGAGAQIRAGCGVVRGSTHDGEYRELLAKLKATQNNLGI